MVEIDEYERTSIAESFVSNDDEHLLLLLFAFEGFVLLLLVFEGAELEDVVDATGLVVVLRTVRS